MRSSCAAMVRPVRGAGLVDLEKRHNQRLPCMIEATSRPMEAGDAMAWGGVVKDVSAGGLKLGLCFPFRPGTYLTVELHTPAGTLRRSLVCRVVHVRDDADGTWTLGCEFLKPLPEADIPQLV
jgi:PilZ domain